MDFAFNIIEAIIYYIVIVVLFIGPAIFLPELLLGDNWKNRDNAVDENKGLIIMLMCMYMYISYTIIKKMIDTFGFIEF